MASGSYARKFEHIPQEPPKPRIPARTTRQLPIGPDRTTRQLPAVQENRVELKTRPLRSANTIELVEGPSLQFLKKDLPWLRPMAIIMACVVVAAFVLILAGGMQRQQAPQLVIAQGGQVIPIQVGGSMQAVNTWVKSNGPIAPKTAIPSHPGPYSVLGKPTLTVDFMNRVLAYYNSPAAGKAQALYDYGVKYGIDPAFALAFFLHESTFGKYGWANVNLSLGNIRCVPEYPCNHGYSQYSSWEQGFEAWYKLIRNLYVAQLGKVTIDQIIPTYAPAADHNDEAAYIASVKHAMDTWHAGIIAVS